jgi:hypothetical protein
MTSAHPPPKGIGMHLKILGGLFGGEQAVLNAIHLQDIVDELQLDLKNVAAKFDAGRFGVHFALGFRGEPVGEVEWGIPRWRRTFPPGVAFACLEPPGN